MRTTASLAVSFLATAALACSGNGGEAAPEPSARPDRAAPTEWPTAGLDLGNTRHVAGGDLSGSTIDGLEERWTAELESLGSLSTVPLVVDGTVYVQGSSGQVAALDEPSGDTVWLSEPTGFNIGPFGVAVDDDHVYALDGSVGVLALDRDTGERQWATDVTATDTTGIDIQPVIAGELVLVSSVPVSISGIYTGGDRGVVTALDRTTGDVRWEFDTVQGDDL